MTYFTEKNHDIWDCGEARGRLLLAEIVAAKATLIVETIFQLRVCLFGWETKILLFSRNSISEMTVVSNSAS